MNRRLRLYLDIDGVFLRRAPESGRFSSFDVAPGAFEFLAWAVERFDCRWLSSRCRNGKVDGALRAFRLARGSSSELQHLVQSVPAAAWERQKTDAIAFDADFLWIDDAADESERQTLARHGRLTCLIDLSVDRDPCALRQAIDQITRRSP